MCLSVSLNQISSLNPLLFFFVLSLGAWAMVGLKLKCSLQGPFGPCGPEIRFEDRAFSLRKDPLGPRSRGPFRFNPLVVPYILNILQNITKHFSVISFSDI